MRFIHPSYLYFLLFALLPIILYFFNLQKTIRVDFSNVEMLEDVKRKTSNRFQVKRFLIMLSRVFFVIFMVLAFAQPTFEGEKNSGAKHHIFFIDNSLSMSRKVESMLLLDHAKSAIEKISPESKGHKFSFVTNDDHRISLDFSSKKDFLKEVSSIKSSSYHLESSQIERLFRRKKSTLPKMYYMVSDFQKTRFENLQSFEVDSSEVLKYVNLQAQNDNVYIDSVWVESQYMVAGNQFNINFNCKNSAEKSKEVLIRCLVEGRQVGSKVVKIDGEDQVSGSLTLQIPSRGFNNCVLQVEDPFVSFDNDFNFVIEANKNIKVLIIKSGERSYFESAYLNEPLFLTKSFRESAFNSSELEGVDLLVLESLENLNSLPIQQVSQFISSGGHVVLVPKSVQEIEGLQVFVKGIGSNLRLGSVKDEKEQVDFAHLMKQEFYQGVFEETKQKVQGVWFNPSFAILNGEAVLKSRKGNVLLNRQSVGKGELFLFTSPIEKTDVFRHSLFVPTSYQIAMASVQINNRLSFEINQDELVVESVHPREDAYYSLVSSRDQYVPEQQVQGKDLVLYLANNEVSGFYDVRSKEDKIGRIALNYDRKESDFSPLNLSSLNNIDNIEIMNWDVLNEQTFETSEESFQLWKWLLILALLCLLFETSLIRFFR